MKNEKNFENINLKINTNEAKSRNEIIEEALAAIEAEVDKELENVEMPTEGEINARIKAILYEAGKMEQNSLKKIENESKDNAKVKKTRKTIRKTLLLVAVVSLLTMVGIITSVASKHDIHIENGFVAYMKEAIVITFFGDDEKYISLEALKSDLELHGYDDIIIPKYFDTVDWKASIPKYVDDDYTERVSFNICNEEYAFDFCIITNENGEHNNYASFLDLDNAETIKNGDINVYVFDYGQNSTQIKYINQSYKYTITSFLDYEIMQNIAKNIK